MSGLTIDPLAGAVCAEVVGADREHPSSPRAMLRTTILGDEPIQ